MGTYKDGKVGDAYSIGPLGGRDRLAELSRDFAKTKDRFKVELHSLRKLSENSGEGILKRNFEHSESKSLSRLSESDVLSYNPLERALKNGAEKYFQMAYQEAEGPLSYMEMAENINRQISLQKPQGRHFTTSKLKVMAERYQEKHGELLLQEKGTNKYYLNSGINKE